MSSPEFLKSARLSFALDCAGARIGFGQDEKTQLFYNLRRRRLLDSVRLSDGSDLMEMPGSLRLVGTDADFSTWKQIGALTFCPAWEGSSDGFIRPQPASYELECAIPTDDLKDLIAAERVNGGPTSVFIQVTEGISYGGASDGSTKIWDVTEQKWVPVDQISFHFDYDNGERERVKGDTENLQTATQQNLISNAATADMRRELKLYSLWIIGLLASIWIALALK